MGDAAAFNVQQQKAAAGWLTTLAKEMAAIQQFNLTDN